MKIVQNNNNIIEVIIQLEDERLSDKTKLIVITLQK